MRKRVISTLLAMATTAGLFAGNVSAVYAEGKSSGDYEYQELEDAEITYYNYSVEGKELYEKEIAAYNEVHPNVKINLELVGGGTDWRSTLKAEISSGQAPDLVVMEGASDFDTFGDMIEDLSDQPWVEHIYENNVSDCKVGDAIVGAPSGVVCYGLLYNKAVFEACGIDGSTLKSYDDIDAAFGKVQDAIDAGEITNAKVDIVISNNASAYALERARKHDIEAVCIAPKDYPDREAFHKALLAKLQEKEVDLIVLAGYLVAIPPMMVEAYPNKIINIHPSLIPSFCGKGFYGLKVHDAVLARGVKVTGATVHFVDAGTDTGPIILQKAVKVKDGDTSKELQRRVMEKAEWKILPEAINLIANDKITVTDGIVSLK